MKAINQVCKVVISACLITTVLAGFKVMSEGLDLIPFLPISNNGNNVNDDNQRNPIPNPSNDNVPAPTIL